MPGWGPFHIVMRGIPVAKGRPRIGRTKSGLAIPFTPANTRSYESALKFQAQQTMGSALATQAAVTVTVTAVLPIRLSWPRKKQAAARAGTLHPTSRPDGDNYAKAALDAMNGVVFVDDSQVVDLRVVKRYGETPCLQISVAEITSDARAA